MKRPPSAKVLIVSLQRFSQPLHTAGREVWENFANSSGESMPDFFSRMAHSAAP